MTYSPRSEALGETNPADTLVLDFQPKDWEETGVCCQSHPSVLLCYGSSSRLVNVPPGLPASMETALLTQSPCLLLAPSTAL